MSSTIVHVFAEGRKHSMLWLSGLGYLAIGLAWIWTGLVGAPDPAFDWLRDLFGPMMESEYLAFIWVIAGAGQLVPALVPKTRKARVDRPLAIGYGMAIIAPSVWAVIYITSGFYGNLYGPRIGVVFLIMAMVAWDISGWEEPSASVQLSRVVKALQDEGSIRLEEIDNERGV